MKPRFWHKVAHFLGSFRGRVVSITVNSNEDWIAFQCTDCGDITQLVRVRDFHSKEK